MTIHLDWSWPIFWLAFALIAIVRAPWLVRDLRRALDADRAEKAARQSVDRDSAET